MTSPMGERQMFPVQTKETVKGDMAAFSPAPPGKATDLGPGAPQAPVPTTASPARPGRADPGRLVALASGRHPTKGEGR